MIGATTQEITISRPERLIATATLPLFAMALFGGSFLLFLVEPMVAKVILPVLGGAPMVWNTCVVFFQAALLIGYGYAYLAARTLDTRQHTVVHVILLALPLASLPFLAGPRAAPPPDANPALWLLVWLAAAIGLPFFALSTGASVLQHWFARTDHAGARDPYFLYGASNLGSLLALAVYPTLIEPALPLRAQSRWWSAGYVAYIGLVCACAVIVRLRTPETKSAADPPIAATSAHAAPSAWRRGRWLLLAFVPSSLMLAVTSYITTDVAAVPLLWILPLGIYLITFIVAFGSASERARAFASRGLPIAVALLAICMVGQIRSPLMVVLPVHLIAFGVLALHCHGALAADRPEPARLTEYYFWISAGGMAGGLFNVLVAPLLFSSIVEYPLAVVIGCALVPVAPALWTRRTVFVDVIVPCAIAAIVVAAQPLLRHALAPAAAMIVGGAAAAFVAFTQRKRTVRFAASIAALLVAGAWWGNTQDHVLRAERTFFGVFRVMQDADGRYRALAHGTTLHGMQALDPAHSAEPLTYYHRTGPFGQAFEALPHARTAKQVAVVGLGIGTLAAYAVPGQQWTFYEIDPAVERIARDTTYFSFLDRCGQQCRVVIGDARLSLTAAPQGEYDLLVLDAFSSDAIPMHLMTDEAFSLYLSRLAPGGVIAFHISNRRLQLGPLVGRQAEWHGLTALQETDLSMAEGKTQSRWVVMARTREDLGTLTQDTRWAPPAGTAQAPLWTDDFSNILSVLSFR
jgi:spermidine synthase